MEINWIRRSNGGHYKQCKRCGESFYVSSFDDLREICTRCHIIQIYEQSKISGKKTNSPFFGS